MPLKASFILVVGFCCGRRRQGGQWYRQQVVPPPLPFRQISQIFGVIRFPISWSTTSNSLLFASKDRVGPQQKARIRKNHKICTHYITK
jgi:hypothetical protein